MEDTFAGLVRMAPMSEKHHSVCMSIGSITQLSKPSDAPFFIARPVEDALPSKTKTLLDLCQELITKTNEQAKMLESLGNEITRLNNKIMALETRANHLQWVNNRDYREEGPFTITYGTTTGPVTQTITPDETITISGSSDGPTTITNGSGAIMTMADLLRTPTNSPSVAGIALMAEEARLRQLRQMEEIGSTFGGMPMFVDPRAQGLTLVPRTGDFRVGMDMATRFPQGGWNVTMPDGSNVSAEDYQENY